MFTPVPMPAPRRLARSHLATLVVVVAVVVAVVVVVSDAIDKTDAIAVNLTHVVPVKVNLVASVIVVVVVVVVMILGAIDFALIVMRRPITDLRTFLTSLPLALGRLRGAFRASSAAFASLTRGSRSLRSWRRVTTSSSSSSSTAG